MSKKERTLPELEEKLTDAFNELDYPHGYCALVDGKRVSLDGKYMWSSEQAASRDLRTHIQGGKGGKFKRKTIPGRYSHRKYTGTQEYTGPIDNPDYIPNFDSLFAAWKKKHFAVIPIANLPGAAKFWEAKRLLAIETEAEEEKKKQKRIATKAKRLAKEKKDKEAGRWRAILTEE